MTPRSHRSRISNGSSLFADAMIDERGPYARRFRDLLSDYVAALGGIDVVSPQVHSISRCAATEKVQLELIERRWALNGKSAPAEELDLYARISNSLRRHLESVGLKYVGNVKDITPGGGMDLDDIEREINEEAELDTS
jgi:hypothetical protein